jgi:hypothetical protein
MIDWKLNLLLLLLLIALYKIYILFYIVPIKETFINNNKQIEENMNQDYSVQNQCSEPNPTLYAKIYKKCIQKYIDLDREILNVPLYLYPSLYFHPMNN